MTDLIEMADSTSVEAYPPGLKAYAGYIGPAGPVNRYVTFPGIVQRFYPHAHLLSIAVHTYLIAACLDVETGDATPDQAPGWYRMVRAHGVTKPCFYANASTMPAVRAALQRAGIPRDGYRLWVASYGSPPVAQVPDGYDAHQYTDHGPGGQNYDRSVCLPGFFGTRRPVVAPAGAHGIVTASVHYDLETDRFAVHGNPDTGARYDRHDRWASAEVQVNVSSGRWRAKGIGWNKRPLKG